MDIPTGTSYSSILELGPNDHTVYIFVFTVLGPNSILASNWLMLPHEAVMYGLAQKLEARSVPMS